MCRWMAYFGDPILARRICCSGRSTRSSTRACTPSSGASPRTVTASASGGTAPARRRPCSRAPIPPGATRICARSPPRSAPRCCSRTSVPRAGRPYSAATATRSGTAGGCGCTTGHSPRFPEVKRDLQMAVDAVAVSEDRGIDRHRDPVLPGPHLRPDRGPAGRGRPRGRPRRRDRPAPRSRVPGPHDRGHQRRRVDLGLPLLQREGTSSLYYSTDVVPAARSCIRSWTSSTAWDPIPASSSPNRCVTCPARGTRSRRARGGSCAGASRRSSPSSRSAAAEPAGRVSTR